MKNSTAFSFSGAGAGAGVGDWRVIRADVIAGAPAKGVSGHMRIADSRADPGANAQQPS